MKLKHSAAALMIAAVLSLASCSDKEIMNINNADDISFSWWGKDIRHSYTISAVKDFVQQNPGIDVRTEYSEFEAFQKRMNVVFAANNECDVMQINYDWLFRFSPDGTGFYDLNKLGDIIDFSNFSEDQLSYGRVNGTLNGIPNALNTETCYYNKSVYEKYGLSLPSSFDDLFEAAKTMSADGVYPIELSKKASWMMSVAYEEQISGKKCFEGTEKVGFSKENFADMISFYKRLVDKKVTKYYPEINKYDFSNGISAGTVCWISDAGYYCDPLIKNGISGPAGTVLSCFVQLLYVTFIFPWCLKYLEKPAAQVQSKKKYAKVDIGKPLPSDFGRGFSMLLYIFDAGYDHCRVLAISLRRDFCGSPWDPSC